MKIIDSIFTKLTGILILLVVLNACGKKPVGTIASVETVINPMTCQASFIWDNNPESNLAGYKLYYMADTPLPGTPAGFHCDGGYQDCGIIIISNKNTATLTGLSPYREYYFALTAFSTTDESLYSDIVHVTDLTTIQKHGLLEAPTSCSE
jgi:hypothetical protein